MPASFELTTARLRLRGWRPDDAQIHRLLWLERDPRVPAGRRIGADGRPTVADLAAWQAGQADLRPFGLLVVERGDEPGMIGYCGLIPGADAPPQLAYELLSRFHGRGYATEAAGAVLERARASGVARVEADVRAWNTASLRVLEKLGFARTGRVDLDPVHGDSIVLARDLEPA